MPNLNPLGRNTIRISLLPSFVQVKLSQKTHGIDTYLINIGAQIGQATLQKNSYMLISR